jgi:phage gp29-like protein
MSRDASNFQGSIGIDPGASGQPAAPDSQVSAQRIVWSIRNKWNPLRDLTVHRMVEFLQSWEVGYLRNATLVWDAMLRRDPILNAVSEKRCDALSLLQWEIAVDDAEDPEAEAQREALEAFYRNITVTEALDQDKQGGVALLVYQMARGGIGLKYAVHEFLWRPGVRGNPDTAVLVEVPAWFFEVRTGKLRYLPQDYMLYGDEMDPAQWVITSGPCLMMASCVAYIWKHRGWSAWANFVDKFGMPGLHGKTKAPQGSDEWNNFVQALKQFGEDFGIATDKDTEIAFVAPPGGTGQSPHAAIVAYSDQSYIIQWRGSDLGTKSGGPQSVGASVQEDESVILLRKDAAWISETAQRQIDRKVLDYKFGEGTPVKARFRLVVPQSTDTPNEIAATKHLLACGAKLPLADEVQRFSRRLAAEGEELLVMPAPAADPGAPAAGELDAANEIDANERAAHDALAEAMAGALTHVRSRLREIGDMTDPALQRAEFDRFEASLGNYASQMADNPATARAIDTAMRRAMADATQHPHEPA